MRKELFLFVSLILFLVFSSISAFGAEELKLDKYQRMSYRVKPTVVKILAIIKGKVAFETGKGQQVTEISVGGGGSGFIVNPYGYVVTNGHVVEKFNNFNTNKDLIEQEILAQFLVTIAKENDIPPTRENLTKLVEKLKPKVVELQPLNFVILSNMKEFRFEIKKYSKSIGQAAMEKGGEGKDIAILKIEAKNLPTVKLGDSDKVKLQELVFAFGYPGAGDLQGLMDLKSRFTEVSITRGTVSAVKADFRGLPIIQSDVAISWGNSGGPSVNENGEVIGVNTMIGIVYGQAIGGFSFLIPVNTVKEFVNAEGIKEESSLFNEIYFQALDKVWAGEWFEGRDLLNKALVFIPDQPDIIKLRMDVETAISKMSWFSRNWQRNRIAMISLGVILILIVGVGLTLLLRKTPQKSAQPEIQVARPPRPSAIAPEGETRVEGRGFGTLTLSTGGQMGKSYSIGEKGLVIGREMDQCDIVISDTNVSRVHAWVAVEKGEVVIIDRGSTNGTFVNHNKVEKAKLNPGDVIHLGQKCPTTLTFNR